MFRKVRWTGLIAAGGFLAFLYMLMSGQLAP